MATKIATDVLKMGFVVVALPGTEIEVSEEDLKRYGWADKVKDAGSGRKTKASRASADTDTPAA